MLCQGLLTTVKTCLTDQSATIIIINHDKFSKTQPLEKKTIYSKTKGGAENSDP
jgi:hypothetical protein